MKKKFKILIMLLIITSIIFISSFSNASTISKESTELYKRYQNLSEEEKKNYIEPLPFSTTYNKKSNTYKKSINNILNSLRASYESEYMIEGLKVGNQQNTEGCWAFSTLSLLESNMLKENKQVIPFFSTRHMEYATSYTFLDGINEKGYKREVGKGANVYLGLNYIISGNGPVLEEDMPFENNEEKIYLADIQKEIANETITEYTSIPAIYKEYQENDIIYTNGYTDLSGARVEYTLQEVQEIRNMVKEQIVKNGAVSAITYAQGEEYYNLDKVQDGTATTYAYYCDNPNAIPDHAITIVGWDDNYSKENFNDAHKPLNDGAYIILNSWGEDVLNNGYIYISYEDALVESMLYGIVKQQEKDYDNIYQHDELGAMDEILIQTIDGQTLNSAYAANVFERNETLEDVETIDKISFSIMMGTKDVELYINPNGDDLTKCEFVADLGTYTPGYYTYELENPIEITKDKFVVALKYNQDEVSIPVEYSPKENSSIQTGDNFWDTAKGNEGESYISPDGQNWSDLVKDLNLKQGNVAIKAYTSYSERQIINVTGINLNMQTNTLNIGDEFTLEAEVLPENATNKNVIWSTSDENIATVDSNGKVKGIGEGTATITATTQDGNKTATCTVEVKENTIIPVTEIQLKVSKDIIKIGEKCSITATIIPENATNKDITWKSTDETIAKVTSNGEVTGIGEGKVTITATNEVNDISQTVIITVIDENNIPPEDENQDNDNNENNNNQNNNNNGDNDETQISPINPGNSYNSNKGNLVLPKAGITYGLIALIVISIIAGIYFFVVLYRNRDI